MHRFQNQNCISQAMHAPDELVIQLEYIDSKGNRSLRIVSPIRFLSSGRFLALCLCRCEPRQFHLDRCSNIQLKPAANYVMPVALMSQAS